MDWKSGKHNSSYNYQIGTYAKVFDADEMYILYFPEKETAELDITFYNKQAYEKYYQRFIQYHIAYKEKIKDVGVDPQLDELLNRRLIVKKRFDELKELVVSMGFAINEYCEKNNIARYQNDSCSISKSSGWLRVSASKKGKEYLELSLIHISEPTRPY